MKKRRLILIFLILSLFLTGVLIYNNFYKIDTRQLQYNFLARIVTSPDGKHEIGVHIRRLSKDYEVSYIQGDLYKITESDDGKAVYSSPKLILWQKENSNDIVNNWIDVQWLDNKTVVINNITLNIEKDVYDYRRDWKH